MVTKYACRNIDCIQCDVSIPEILVIKSVDGMRRVCSECGGPMIVTQSIAAALCPEYDMLREEYFDAARECQAALIRPATSVYSTGLRRQAIGLKDLARERLMAHKGSCLLCANIPSEGRRSA
jgi:hypothetical protein